MSPPKSAKRKQKASMESSEDEEYRRRRDRNNLAVKRSRVKSRMRTQETLERVQALKTENDQLEEKIKHLSRELSFLKELFLAHASSSNGLDPKDIDLEQLLRDTDAALESLPGPGTTPSSSSSGDQTPLVI